MLDPGTFDLKTLSALTGVAPRTVHFYVQQGLLPPPDGAGRAARYTHVHRDRLTLIRRLQDQHLPLAEIRRHLDRIPDAMLGKVASSRPSKPKSAADYIRSVLAGEAPAPSGRRSSSAVSRLYSYAPPLPLLDGSPPDRHGPDRSQWERLVVHPDVEIHLRRPGSRATNRKVEKLVEFARSIFREEP